MTHSFTTRVTLLFAILVTATTAVVFAVGGWLLNREMTQGLELLHETEFFELCELIGPNPTTDAHELERRIRHDTISDAALYFVQIHNQEGLIVFRSGNLGDAVLPDLSGHGPHWTSSLPGVGPVHISEFHSGPWHLQIASAVTPLRHLLHNYASIGGVLVLAVGLLSLGLGYAFSRLTLRPVRAIEQTARRIRADNLGERIPVPPGRDELSALATLLNQMFDRLEVSFEQTRRFTGDASHELKTPLALIRLNAEKLRPRLTGDAEALATLEDLLEQMVELHRIIESLLFLSKAESGVLSPEFATIEVPAFLRDFAEDAIVLAEDRGAKFELGRVEPGELCGARVLLRQLLLNLVTNALEVMPGGGRVTLTGERQGTDWIFTLLDEGPGLPEAQLTRVFERFARYEHPQTSSGSPGHGLGLAIGKSIVELHGGTMRAENRADRCGLRMVVTLPAQQTS